MKLKIKEIYEEVNGEKYVDVKVMSFVKCAIIADLIILGIIYGALFVIMLLAIIVGYV